jgi:surface polysaccharide O-acyltransferase-like enzyme
MMMIMMMMVVVVVVVVVIKLNDVCSGRMFQSPVFAHKYFIGYVVSAYLLSRFCRCNWPTS